MNGKAAKGKTIKIKYVEVSTFPHFNTAAVVQAKQVGIAQGLFMHDELNRQLLTTGTIPDPVSKLVSWRYRIEYQIHVCAGVGQADSCVGVAQHFFDH